MKFSALLVVIPGGLTYFSNYSTSMYCRTVVNISWLRIFDFKLAYDSVDRDQLCHIINENVLPDNQTRLDKATMDMDCSSFEDASNAIRISEGFNKVIGFHVAIQHCFERCDPRSGNRHEWLQVDRFSAWQMTSES